MEKIIVTGSCGFIGMHLADRLLQNGNNVLGIDNMNSYYNPKLKKDRLEKLRLLENFSFIEIDITNQQKLDKVFADYQPDKVVNLAAQAGVRYSLQNPSAYIDSNIIGFMNILECCRNYETQGLVYASSSSVYGGNKKMPFSVKDPVDKPISIYAASKKSNELMAYSYNHLFGLNTTGLRFFTVYGPWGRPDMAMYIFSDKIWNDKPIQVFNHGNMSRDFTYIDDIVDGIIASIEKNYSCEIFNLGNNHSEDLMKMIKLLEHAIGKKADIEMAEIQPGDVKQTFADINDSKEKLGYSPKISIEDGIPKFIEWFKNYHSIS
tara:strand:- start:1477 stop:2436 length:960 start_codon:yes stop_codon:yes gene_type:complete